MLAANCLMLLLVGKPLAMNFLSLVWTAAWVRPLSLPSELPKEINTSCKKSSREFLNLVVVGLT